MIYKEFFRIGVEHPYFSSGGAADLAFVPDARTLRLLKGRHCIIKGTDSGLMVLIPTDENGIAKATPDEALVFEVFPGSSTFSSVTDTSDLGEGEILHFSNDGLSGTDLQLLTSARADRGSLNGFPMVAKVEILPTNALLTSTGPVRYQVVFKAKSAKWRYYFVSDHETSDLSIVDMDEKLVFKAMDWETPPPDKTGAALRLRFPDANLFLFESETEITYSDRAVRNLQLYRDGHLIVKHLPNPDIGDAAIKIIKVHKLISNQ